MCSLGSPRGLAMLWECMGSETPFRPSPRACLCSFMQLPAACEVVTCLRCACGMVWVEYHHQYTHAILIYYVYIVFRFWDPSGALISNSQHLAVFATNIFFLLLSQKIFIVVATTTALNIFFFFFEDILMRSKLCVCMKHQAKLQGKPVSKVGRNRLI